MSPFELDMEKEYGVEELIAHVLNLMGGQGISDNDYVQKIGDEYGSAVSRIVICISTFIAFFNYLAFGDEDVNIGIFKNHSSFIAAYDPRRDRYSVIISNAEKLAKERYLGYVTDFNEDGSFHELFQGVGPFLLSIALHEVRHRLQKKKRVKMFSCNRITRDKRINHFIKFRKYLYAYEKKTCREGHVWKKIIESRYSPKEFDADVIDHYFSAEMIGRGRLSLSEIRTILLLSPIRLFNE